MGPPFGREGARLWPPIPRLWEGQTVCIIAGGESASEEASLEKIRGKAKVIAVNNAFRLAPWADLLYACDAKWWDEYRDPQDGLAAWTETRIPIKVSLTATIGEVHRLPYDADAPGLSLDPLRLHTIGGNGGGQAMNLAVLMGASRIVLIGFDMQGEHWHGRHPHPLTNPGADNFEKWIDAIGKTAPDLAKVGVEVINASRRTALNCFARRDLAEIFP